MNRSEFLKKSALTAAGAFALPYILPSGRLFAQSGVRTANHVVLVLFAGGVRHQESVGMQYLDGSQPNDHYPGNIMYNMLSGAAPTMKIVYGTGEGGQTPIPPILNSTLQQQGTLFAEVGALSRGHYGGLNSLLQGSAVEAQGLKSRPINPTIFEYLRRHGGYSATDVWFVGNTIGGSLPYLNYSAHPDYGISYGANFFSPYTTFADPQLGQTYFGHGKVYNQQNEIDPMYRLKAFLDSNFHSQDAALSAIGNTDEEKQNIKEFMRAMYEKTLNGTLVTPPVISNGDLVNVAYTAELLQWFKPTFTVVNLSSVDQCHSNFTGYLGALHRADHAVGFLWDYIQTQIPEMAGNTSIIAIPECGRNQSPNAIVDVNGWRAYDHSDENALRIWSLMAGPSFPSNLVRGGVGNTIGQASDAMLTVAEILGVKNETINAGLMAAGTQSFIDLL
jgi:hypothetical protein